MGMLRRPEPLSSGRVIINPSYEELRSLSRHEEKTTVYGSPGYISRVRNRSAKFTYIVEDGVPLGVDQQGMPAEKALSIANRVYEYLKGVELIRMDRQMGLNPNFKLNCRLYITSPYARIPLKWQQMLFDPGEYSGEPDLISIYVPEWPEKVIFCHPEERITFILGTDYFGEAKKSFLRMAMYGFKRVGGLGFHAGSKVLRTKDGSGALKDTGFILFGLSGTGKTTLTMHDHGLISPETVFIRQDDVVMMSPDGYCYGTENGFYIKTEGLDESQAVLYQAAISPTAIFENVMIDEGGEVRFDNADLTSNGRGVILRKEVKNTDSSIDLKKADKIIFITRRNDIVPPVARLSPEQGAAFFMLGESIETSAGDPTKAGQSKREVGTNPFIVGPEAEEGNRLLEILRNNPDMECYLLNTGSVGAGVQSPGTKITIGLSTDILREIARGTIKWKADPDWGYLVPEEIQGIDLGRYRPESYYDGDEYRRLVNSLRQERVQWLGKYKDLKKEIVETI
ncbi:MAG: phosphoenolpyruvate carboxykinase [Peptococcaceae bacterium BICA1-7]|nr:MAG: phosphoenolpyruvate carboxykinase [Peptococcaceae bacterium BICA1-7]HBV98789.1 phosphoenolpyruvate carboxykinase (ATP) [Desulfotomaculum sp.]